MRELATPEMKIATEIASRVGRLLVERGWALGLAESCTGGLVSHMITNVPGSSAFFIGGVVAYANEAKRSLLGVPQEVLARCGAVSAEVAIGMAEGIRELLGTEVGVAVTGIAGPTGGTPMKPVGTTFIAVSSPLGHEVRHHLWSSNRLSNKRCSAEAALRLLEDWLVR